MKGIELDKEELVLLRRFTALVGLKVSTAETREAILSSDKTDAFERVNDALTFIGLRVEEVKPNLKAIEPSQAPFLLVNERGVINLVDEINDEYVIVSSASGGSRKKQKRSEFNTIVSSRLILAERNLEPKTDTRERLRLLNLFSVLGAGNFAWIAVATGMSNVLSLASSLFIMVVYDRILPNQSLNSLYALSVGVALAILFDFLLKEARQSIISRVTNASDHKLNAEIYEQ